MSNLSQIKRQRMIEFLERLKEEHKDDDVALIALGEIESELNAKKYGLVWEDHEEAVDVKMQTHIPVFERTGDMMTYQKGYRIEVKDSPAMNVLTNRAMMSVDEFGKYYSPLFERVPKERVTPTGINGSRYYDKEFDRESSDIELFIGIKEKDKADEVMEPRLCAMTLHRGSYSTLSEAYGAVVSWIMENGYEMAGEPFELYLRTQFDTLSPEEWETEVYFPVRKK